MKKRFRKPSKLNTEPSLITRPVMWPEKSISGGVTYGPVPFVQPYTGYPAIPIDKGIKIVSWNVNGIDRMMRLNASLIEQISIREHPQVICIQKTKLEENNDLLDEMMSRKYVPHYNCSKIRKKYGGVVTFLSKNIEVEEIIHGIPGAPEFSNEGRLTTVILPKMMILNVLFPSSGKNLNRHSDRINIWDVAFKNYASKLLEICREQDKHLVIAGDFAVAAELRDMSPIRQKPNSSGCTIEERNNFTSLLNIGLSDTFRKYVYETDWYTYWPSTDASRERNMGMRHDYILASPSCYDLCIHSCVLNAYHGSNHCPVVASFSWKLPKVLSSC